MSEPGELFRFERPGTRTPALSEEIRNNFNALGQSNYSTDSAKPDTTQRRDGMPRLLAEDPNNVKYQVFFDGAFRTLMQNVHLGFPAPAKSVVQITTPASVWQIDHNLGSQPIVQVHDASWSQLRPVHTYPEQAAMVARLGPVHLSTLIPGPPVPVRAAWVFPYNGAIVGAQVAVDDSVIGPLNITVDFDINGNPITGGTVLVPGGSPPGLVFPGLPITGANLFTPSDALGISVSVDAPVVSGNMDVFLVLQRTLNTGEYLLQHATENRVIVTHPAAVSGYAVVIG